MWLLSGGNPIQEPIQELAQEVVEESRGILQDFFAWWAEHPYLGTIAVVALVLIFGDVVRRRRARR